MTQYPENLLMRMIAELFIENYMMREEIRLLEQMQQVENPEPVPEEMAGENG